MPRIRPRVLLTLVLFAAACRLDSRDNSSGDDKPRQFGLGRPASAAEIAAVDIDASPDGVGLPAGSGTPEQGAVVYAQTCAVCHGANGEGHPPLYPQLLGGPKAPVDFAKDAAIPRTIGNYWPYATSVFDYVRRAMPFDKPGSLTIDQTYAVTAYLLEREGLIPARTVTDARSLPTVKMPALSQFVIDDRDETHGGAKVR